MNEPKTYQIENAQRQQKANRLRDALESLCVDVRNGEMEPAMIVAGEKFDSRMPGATCQAEGFVLRPLAA